MRHAGGKRNRVAIERAPCSNAVSVTFTGMRADAEALLRSMNQRVTRPRLAVMDVLLRANRALSHQEIESAARGAPMDRVTLYRVLGWLVEKGLAHRILGPDRVTRYVAERPGEHGHAHFACDGCGKVLCLHSSRVGRIGVPRGFRLQSVEMTAHGLCNHCTGSRAASGGR